MPLMLVVGCINKYPPPGPGWTVTHVDLSARGIWDAEQGKNVPIDVQADMRALPFPDASVDRVQSWHALEHVNEQGGRDTIREFARVLKPGGILDIRVPDLAVLTYPPDYPDEPEDVIARRLPLIYGEQRSGPDAHLNAHQWGYTRQLLWDLLTGYGFEPVETKVPEHDDELHLIARR